MARIANKIAKEQNKVEELTSPNTKTVVGCCSQGRGAGKSRQIDRLNRTESPERNPHKCSQLTFDKGTEAVGRSKDSPFNKWWNVAMKHRSSPRDHLGGWQGGSRGRACMCALG